MKSHPKVSVVTISYNQARFLERCILSVINQNFESFEYIVVDAGSTDGSIEILNRYKDNIDKLLIGKDEGPADGLNRGFEHASGQIYGFLNSDDELCEGALEKVVEKFGDDVDVLSGSSEIIGERNEVLSLLVSRKFSPKRFVFGAATLSQPSTFFRSEAFKDVGGFNVSNRIAWDGELWFEFGRRGCKFRRIDDVLSKFRLYPGSISSSLDSDRRYVQFMERMFLEEMGRQKRSTDAVLRVYYKAIEYILVPRLILHRLHKCLKG